jgi:hypothetical protein
MMKMDHAKLTNRDSCRADVAVESKQEELRMFDSIETVE